MDKQETKEPFEVIQSRHYANTFDGSDSAEFTLQDIMHFCGMMRTGFSKDSNEMAYNAGKRDVILYILQKLNLNEMQVFAKTQMNNILNKEFSKSSTGSDYAKAVFGGDRGE